MEAADWDERYRSAELVWGSEPNQFVRQQCEGLPVGDALDLACGEGRNALWLARLGWTVTGVDYSAAAIERAESLTAREPAEVAERLTWRVADITRELPPPGSVDLGAVSQPKRSRRDPVAARPAVDRPEHTASTPARAARTASTSAAGSRASSRISSTCTAVPR